MTLSSLMEFIDTSLFETSSFELSYKDPNQKWIIRDQILKLLQDFPSLIPSTDTFVHFDGSTMNLLNINGFLHVSDFLPEVPLIIWVHENYPLKAPMIFIPSNPDCPIHKNHPFIDQSGVVTPHYILNWDPKESNLCDLVHNLKILFRTYDHPSMPSPTLKSTILDDLYVKICDDFATLDVQNRREIERLWNEQTELRKRGNILDSKISREENERDKLEKRVAELSEYNDRLMDWIREYEKANSSMNQLANQIFGKKSMKVDCLIEDRALDDVIDALSKALEQGVVSLDVYIKQVRRLARDQFYYRALRLKLKNPRSS